MSYTIDLSSTSRAPTIVVVGCGGTGGYVAEGLCRLLLHSELDILLIDHDRVETHNLRRQNFFEGEIGEFKSRALAERLARQYGRKIGWCVYPFDRDILNTNTAIGTMLRRAIIIGCVDRPRSRRAIAESLEWEDWWLDVGNDYQSGQVLIGNVSTIDRLEGAFDVDEHTVGKLPTPALQLPALLTESTIPEDKLTDCAEEVEDNRQSPVINQAMATLVLDFMYKLLDDKLTSMGAYLDLETGSLQYIPAEPVTVAKMFGVKVDNLCIHEEGCHIGGRRQVLGRRRQV